MAVFVGGLAIGSVYALVALGVILIFRATSVVNFAQGELLMLSAYAYVLVGKHTTSPFLQLVVPLATGIAGGLVCFAVTQFLLRHSTALVKVIGTLALLVFAQATVTKLFSANARPAKGWIVGQASISVGGTRIADNSLILIGFMVVTSALLFSWLGLTNYGRGMRAVAEDPWRAALSGIHVNRMLATSWVVGGLMAGIAGLLLAPITDVYPTMGAAIIFPAFTAALLGGFTNLLGAVLGGVLLGLLQTYSVVYVGAAWENVVVFLVLLGVLLWRPSGILGAGRVRAV